MSAPPPRRNHTSSSSISKGSSIKGSGKPSKSPSSHDARVINEAQRLQRNKYDWRKKREVKGKRVASRIKGYKKVLKKGGYEDKKKKGGDDEGGGIKGMIKGRKKKSDPFAKSMAKKAANEAAKKTVELTEEERKKMEEKKAKDRVRKGKMYKRKTGKGQVKMDGVIKDLLGKIKKSTEGGG